MMGRRGVNWKTFMSQSQQDFGIDRIGDTMGEKGTIKTGFSGLIWVAGQILVLITAYVNYAG